MQLSKIVFDKVWVPPPHPQIGVVGGVIRHLKMDSYCVAPHFESYKKTIIIMRLNIFAMSHGGLKRVCIRTQNNGCHSYLRTKKPWSTQQKTNRVFITRVLFVSKAYQIAS